jgi:tetratricopeptide (TPR) repeat protein
MSIITNELKSKQIANVMSKSIMKIAVAFVVAAFVSGCVTTKLPETYEVTPKVLETHGGKIAVSIKGIIPAKSFHKKAIVELTPVLKYNGGVVELKPFTLKGEKAVGSGTTINTKTGGAFTYSDVVDYKPALNTSELFVRAKLTQKKKIKDLGEFKIADGVIYTSTRIGSGTETTQSATHRYEKETIQVQKATLYFAYNASNLNEALPLNKNNKAEIEKIEAELRKGWTIKNISINAWASPEGEQTLNEDLANERAKTGNKYMIDILKKLSGEKNSLVNYKKPEEEVKWDVKARGEDYDGFMKALETSTIKDKATIGNVIKSQSTKLEREQQIKNMTVIYAEIEQMLEVLRRSEFMVSSLEPKKSDEQIARFSTTSPDSLQIEELFYAATLTNDPNTQLAIYKSATKVFDKDWRGYNNAAAICLNQGKLDEASDLLNKANAVNPNNGMILNNLGVVAARKGDFKAAKTYYEQAQAQGVNVSYNLGVLMILDGNYGGALANFSGRTCDYNVGLAQLMNGSASDAQKTLECAPASAEGHYLLAIIGARTGNLSLMTQNLTKACQMVPSYKTQAKEDREFIKYFDNADFQNAIR